MSARFYMHTLDGRPAYFDGEQIVYANDQATWEDVSNVCVLRRSLRQIRADQRRTEQFRKRNHFSAFYRLGWVIVGTEPGELPKPRRRVTR